MSSCQHSALCILVVLMYLLCTLCPGSSQSVRTGFIGGEVLLPCVYSEWLSEPVTAFWRDKDDNVVLDIINGKEDKMDPKFRGRVFSFPNHYKTGNLSIIIKGLRADDAGPYDCDIPKVDYQTKMTLKVTDTSISTMCSGAVYSQARQRSSKTMVPHIQDNQHRTT